MRNQRNFRGQSGKPTTFGTSRATMKIQCHCMFTYIDDMTGTPLSGLFICTGTITANVANCSCCKRGRKGGQDAPNAFTAG